MAILDEWMMELLTRKNSAHVATIRPDGMPHTTIIWVDTADGHVLVNSAVGRVNDLHLRRDPRVSVTVHQGRYVKCQAPADSKLMTLPTKVEKVVLTYVHDEAS
jgi:hypothetical protein